MINLSIIGLGYIGLPTAVLFADVGLKVCGYDVNNDIIKSVNNGYPHFQEPDLKLLLKKNRVNNNFIASDSLKPSDAFIIAVPTPMKADKSPDLSFVEQAIKDISGLLKEGNLIILESTIPVGTCKK